MLCRKHSSFSFPVSNYQKPRKVNQTTDDSVRKIGTHPRAPIAMQQGRKEAGHETRKMERNIAPVYMTKKRVSPKKTV
jgi:hypothetical protein